MTLVLFSHYRDAIRD